MSVAPSSTALLSRAFRSMRTRTRDRPLRVFALALSRSGLEGPPGVARMARDGVDQPDGALFEPGGGARVAEVALDELLECPEGDREAGESEGGAGEALEGDLCPPAGGGERRDPPRDRLLVRLEPCGPAGQEVESRLHDQQRREEGLVHAVAREGIDEPRRVAEHGGAAAREAARRATHRQPVAAQVACGLRVDAVLLAETSEASAEVRRLALVAADADVDVIALREDPAVAAVNDADRDDHRAAIPRVVGVVRFECH